MPDFGLDAEVKDTFGALAASETQHKRKWEWKLLPKEAFDRAAAVSTFQADLAN